MNIKCICIDKFIYNILKGIAKKYKYLFRRCTAQLPTKGWTDVIFAFNITIFTRNIYIYNSVSVLYPLSLSLNF